MVTATSSKLVFYPFSPCTYGFVIQTLSLASTTVDDGGLELQLDLSGAAASGLKLLDNLHAGFICNFSKDNMFAIEPGSDDGGDEELGTVSAKDVISIETSATDGKGDGVMEAMICVE
jgi:hypothetical protein